MKNSVLFAISLLFSSLTNASNSMLATVNSIIGSKPGILSFTLNNQGSETIETDSRLVPYRSRTVDAQASVIFNIDNPQEEGVQKIRYSDGKFYGCDFYLNTQDMSITDTPVYVTYVAAIPISSGSTCEIYTSGQVNHLVYRRTYS